MSITSTVGWVVMCQKKQKNSVATAKKAATSDPGPTPRAAGAKHRSYGSKLIQDQRLLPHQDCC